MRMISPFYLVICICILQPKKMMPIVKCLRRPLPPRLHPPPRKNDHLIVHLLRLLLDHKNKLALNRINIIFLKCFSLTINLSFCQIHMLPALLPAPISSSHLTASSYYVPYEYDNKTSKPETSIHITGSLAECGGHGEICSYKGYYLCQKKPEPRPFAFDLDIQEKTQYIVASEINRALTKYMDVLQQAINEKFKSYKGRFPICPQTNQPYLPFREMKIPLTPTQRNPPRIRAWNVYDTKSNDTKSNDTKSDTKNEPTLHPIKSNRFNKKCQVCKRKQ